MRIAVASIYSSAIVASSPVKNTVSSSGTASQTKACVSFISPKDDSTYFQMAECLGNTNIHKNWHKWDDGHDFFSRICLTHSNENLSQASINWFEKHSLTLKDPSFEPRLGTIHYVHVGKQTIKDGDMLEETLMLTEMRSV